MTTDMINNATDESDLRTFEVIATTTTSSLAETAKHEDTGYIAPQIHENVTASYNFNTSNFTATSLTRLLEDDVTTKAIEESLPITSHLENATVPQETTSKVISSSSSAFFPVVPVENSTVVENVQTLSSDSLSVTASSVEMTSGHLSDVDVEVQQASNVGVAVGVAIGGFVLLAIVVAIIIFFIRRRRIKRRKDSQVVMENPRYATLTRDSTIPRNFDLTMHTGPLVRNQLNNNSQESLTRTNGKRKKEAPRPPIYRPPGGKDTGSKRKAPLPPKLGELGYEDLYERDSAAGSKEDLELATFLTADNHNAEPVAADSKASHSKPLLESFKPEKKSPKRSSKVDSGERPTDEDSVKHDDEDKNEDEQMKTALLGKTKAGSNLSLDSYDKVKNPFFGE